MSACGNLQIFDLLLNYDRQKEGESFNEISLCLISLKLMFVVRLISSTNFISKLMDETREW